MIRSRLSLGRSLPRLLAALLIALVPAAVLAETVTFRNDIRGKAVTVQTTSVVNGVIKRDQYLLRTNETTPKIKTDYEKVLTVTDPRTGQTLYKDVLRVSKKEASYSITLDRKGKVTIVAVPAGGAAMKKP
jgi:hypothetical protein